MVAPCSQTAFLKMIAHCGGQQCRKSRQGGEREVCQIRIVTGGISSKSVAVRLEEDREKEFKKEECGLGRVDFHWVTDSLWKQQLQPLRLYVI